MAPGPEPLLSSHALLLVAMGVVGTIGALHLWFSASRERGHGWVALWCLGTLLHQGARYVQIHTTSPEVAIQAARVFVGVGPLLVWSWVGFAHALVPEARARRIPAWLLAPALLLSGVILFTRLVISGRTTERIDWFGHAYIGAPATPIVLVLLPAIVGALLYGRHMLTRSALVGTWPHRVLLGSLCVYATMAFTSVLSGMHLLSVPTTVEYGPLAVALGLATVLVERHRRLQTRLAEMVEERTAEIAAAHDRLAESETRYRSLVENAPIGVFAVDAEGVLVAVNPKLVELLNQPPEYDEAGRLNVLTFPLLVKAGISERVRRCLETDTVVTGQHRYTSSWGATRDARLTLAATRDVAGRVTGAVGLVEDVTERHVLERCLRQSQKMESVGQLAAGIAHEINNPMTYVRSNLKALHGEWHALRPMLAKSDLPTEAEERFVEWEELLEDSLEGVERTVAIVRDMKEFSHAGGEGRERADLNHLLEASVRMATTHQPRHCRLVEEYGDLPPLECAPGPLRQVFVNLLVNAIDAIEATGGNGEIRVTTGVRDGSAWVRIADDGCGMPSQVQERIFDPFFTTKEAGQGTGLGLYVSWQIVRLHEGEIRVESAPGRGAVFEVRLPLAATRDAATP